METTTAYLFHQYDLSNIGMICMLCVVCGAHKVSIQQRPGNGQDGLIY